MNGCIQRKVRLWTRRKKALVVAVMLFITLVSGWYFLDYVPNERIKPIIDVDISREEAIAFDSKR